jgi:hypothetical protein
MMDKVLGTNGNEPAFEVQQAPTSPEEDFEFKR